MVGLLVLVGWSVLLVVLVDFFVGLLLWLFRLVGVFGSFVWFAGWFVCLSLLFCWLFALVVLIFWFVDCFFFGWLVGRLVWLFSLAGWLVG